MVGNFYSFENFAAVLNPRAGGKRIDIMIYHNSKEAMKNT